MERASGEKSNGQGHKVAVVDVGVGVIDVIDISDLVMDVPEPEPGPVTPAVVKILRSDPDLAEVAEIAEEYA